MDSAIQATLRDLEALAKRHESVLVSFSGGKDSLVTMDLCAKFFKSVQAFFWYAVPGLEHIDKQLSLAKQRWGVNVIQIPHWDILNAFRDGVWCDVKDWMAGIPEITLRHAYAYCLRVTKASLIANGMKEADGWHRRMFFARTAQQGNAIWQYVVSPIRHWSKKDVLDYLTANGIPIPPLPPGAVGSGVGLMYADLTWLHDTYPNDFKKLLRWFPYAEAVTKRREWFEREEAEPAK